MPKHMWALCKYGHMVSLCRETGWHRDGSWHVFPHLSAEKPLHTLYLRTRVQHLTPHITARSGSVVSTHGYVMMTLLQDYFSYIATSQLWKEFSLVKDHFFILSGGLAATLLLLLNYHSQPLSWKFCLTMKSEMYRLKQWHKLSRLQIWE